MNLPEDFLNSMSKLLGNEYEEFLHSYDDKSLSGLRVNTSKISVKDFISIAPYDITPIPYIDNGFYIDELDPWTKHPYYFAGLYYIQEPSAMIPANVLPLEDGDYVLDLCAAPGGKSSELATKAKIKLIANDISFSRTIPLVKNLEMAGAKDLFVTCESPDKLQRHFVEYFDKILVDAPCSGEGMFRKDKGLITAYKDRKPKDYAVVQKEIVSQAANMLKPGGKLLYSTCTFSPIEDEEVIIDLLDNRSDFHLVDIKPIKGAKNGYREYLDICPDLNKCIHIFPHKLKGEGHFVALLEKDVDTDVRNSHTKEVNAKLLRYKDLPEEIISFFKFYSEEKLKEFEKASYIKQDNMIFMISDDFIDGYNKNLHYSRTGTLIGNLGKNGGFTPYTGLALKTSINDFKNVCNLKAVDGLSIKYLKGETLILEDSRIDKGYVLMCVDGYSLGFAKSDGTRLKNLYEKGWRLN